ncbi:AarF/ABC1/UbiB kinase family protein [Ramlibacter ginsenosidimutans]|uniref:AarF/ABC1/UbiB kinase family protein n=1 Tax=Ramlibacter ginsenosidimutans TaxID=502333 RepID=A0A934TUH5_9BURK|nr:AarF/UbiB family protein [Ramlibacter ginsenosidimutans]MBK6007648.1 AarF/ABC1/UbiB kinase family protein [Ramlibacter ginsenosidimutans]
MLSSHSVGHRLVRLLPRVVLLLLAITGARILLRFGRMTPAEFDHYVGRELRDNMMRASGVFVKFGQILSMRPDVLPYAVCQELAQLLDSVAPEPYEESAATLRESWGGTLRTNEIVSMEVRPLAAASFATVYRAVLANGTRVAVKVQRRHIEGVVRADLRILHLIALVLDSLTTFGRLSITALVEDFAAWTQEELDYTREAAQMSRMRDALGDDSAWMVIPRVHWEFCSTRVLVVDLLEGTWLSELVAHRDRERDDRDRIARAIFSFLMRQAFELGYFHADPHAGNLCLLDDGRIGLVDFGIIGHIGKAFQETQVTLLSSIETNDIDSAFAALSRILEIPPDADMDRFRTLVERNFNSWVLRQHQPNLPTVDRSASQLLIANFRAARECNLAFSQPAARYYRAFIVLDSVIVSLSDSFNHREEISRYFRERSTRVTRQIRDRLGTAEGRDFARALLTRLTGLAPQLATRIEQELQQKQQPDWSTSQSRLGWSNFLRVAGWSVALFGVLALASAIVDRTMGVPPPLALLPALFLSLPMAALLAGAGLLLLWASRYMRVNAFRHG